MKGTPDYPVGIYLFGALILAIIVFVLGMALADYNNSKAFEGQLETQFYSGFESGYKTGLDRCYELLRPIDCGNNWCDRGETISNCLEDCKAKINWSYYIKR